MTPDEENQLVREAQTNLEQFEVLYALYLPKVYGFVMNKVRSASLAEDLTSEIFVKVLEGLPRYRFQGRPFGAWVFQIVRNHLLDHYAKQGRSRHDTLEDPTWLKDENELNDPAALARQKNTRDTLEKQIDTLPLQEAEVVRLKYFAELSNQEIAATLNLQPNHVGVLLFRALKKLKQSHV